MRKNKNMLTALCLASLMLTAPPDQAQSQETADTTSCETAYAYGSRAFSEISDLENARWGWEIILNGNDALITSIYAGAGQNDTSKGP